MYVMRTLSHSLICDKKKQLYVKYKILFCFFVSHCCCKIISSETIRLLKSLFMDKYGWVDLPSVSMPSGTRRSLWDIRSSRSLQLGSKFLLDITGS